MISVIIPIYNAETTLRRCLDSILSQSYRSLEIIVVDDGSKDTSGNLCDEYGEKNDRVVVIHQENQGVSAARNRGIDIASGEYVAFIDSDDYVDSDYFQVLLEGIERFNADFGMSALTAVPHIDMYTCLKSNNDIVSLIIGLKYGINAAPYNKIFKKHLIGNLRFDPQIYMGEDTLFAVEYAKKCRKGIFINKAMYHYNERTSSTSYMRDPSKLYKYLTYAESRRRMLLDASMLSQECQERLTHSYFSSILNCYYQSRFFHNKKEERIMCGVMREALKLYSLQGLSTRQKAMYWIMGNFPSCFPLWNAVNTRLLTR
mgnify:CR=1 FL=1